MKNFYLTIFLILGFLLITNLAATQTNDGICVPATTIMPVVQTNPVPPNPIIACSNGVGLPTFAAASGSLPDDEFVVEINGVIDVSNTTGSPASGLSNGDQICVSAFTYDLVAINNVLISLDNFCGSPFVDCDATFMAPGVEQAISDLVNGVNDGVPGINDLEELFTFASAFGTPITSVTQAAAALDDFNAQAGGIVGNICYASSAPICYTIDDGNVACTPMPVELINFNSFAKDGEIQLLWQTASETNNQGFEIQVSNDFSNWRAIGFVDGKGTTSVNQQYTYLDKTPFNGINYYRLKQIDLDGKYEYSSVKSVRFVNRKIETSLTIFPNPVANILNYQLVNSSEILRVELFQLNGCLVKSANKLDGVLDVAELNAGTYLLVITTTKNCLKQLVIRRSFLN